MVLLYQYRGWLSCTNFVVFRYVYIPQELKFIFSQNTLMAHVHTTPLLNENYTFQQKVPVLKKWSQRPMPPFSFCWIGASLLWATADNITYIARVGSVILILLHLSWGPYSLQLFIFFIHPDHMSVAKYNYN